MRAFLLLRHPLNDTERLGTKEISLMFTEQFNVVR